jgi:hypothetical protein
MPMPVARVTISASPMVNATFNDGGLSAVANPARIEARIFPKREVNSIFSRIPTILACMPMEN